MKKNLWVKVILIFALTTLATFVSIPGSSLFGKEFKLELGLDLSGGSRMVFEADTKQLGELEKEKALNSLKETIERRVNLFGVAEANVQTSKFEGKDRVIVELPGITDPKQAVILIGQTAQLVFSEVQEVPLEGSATPSATLVPTDLTGADLVSADVVFDQNTGNPAVSIVFNNDGAKKFEELTQSNIGKPLAIVLDGGLVSAPVVQDK
ncbi:protein translocase subunit SecDF, partial [Candidatus Microgenomates bacterium]|nr:protein translocase subunit SecDF [Candidatus Microgenomates bacterium]